MTVQPRAGEILNPEIRPPEPKGLLSYERDLIKILITKFTIQKYMAADEVARAVENSGGDWALDDDSVKAAGEHAHLLEVRTSELPAMLKLEKDSILDIPSGDKVVRGSRVTIDWGDEDYEVYDLVTRILPDTDDLFPHQLITTEAPMGLAIMSAKEGDELRWSTQGKDSGRYVVATLASIDQVAQQTAFDFAIAAVEAQIAELEQQ